MNTITIKPPVPEELLPPKFEPLTHDFTEMDLECSFRNQKLWEIVEADTTRGWIDLGKKIVSFVLINHLVLIKFSRSYVYNSNRFYFKGYDAINREKYIIGIDDYHLQVNELWREISITLCGSEKITYNYKLI